MNLQHNCTDAEVTGAGNVNRALLLTQLLDNHKSANTGMLRCVLTFSTGFEKEVSLCWVCANGLQAYQAATQI